MEDRESHCRALPIRPLSCCLWALFLFLFFSGCGLTDRSRITSTSGTVESHWLQTAPTCGGFPSKDDCDDGDSVIYGGLLCAAGEDSGCHLVRSSQAPDGRWWRSPRRNPENIGEGNSFSRDMALGVLLYLARTRDLGAARAWLSWIEDNRPCVQTRPWDDGCVIRGAHRYCTDDSEQRCTLTPGSWALMARVWDHLGLDQNEPMRTFRDADGDALWTQAQHAPIGYQTHLIAGEILLKQFIDNSREGRERAARILAERQPDNPFFVVLRDGGSPSLLERVYSLCPRPESPVRNDRHQWAWERETAEEAWRTSMHWDCLFLSKLIMH